MTNCEIEDSGASRGERPFFHWSFVIRHLLLAASLPVAAACAADWPSWRGPEQNGDVREAAVVKKWSPEGENLIWKSAEGGRSTPIIMKGRMFFIGPVGDEECLQERVICLDAGTGRTLWEYRFNVRFTDVVAQRVGWTSVVGDVETGNIYAHGTGGDLVCLDRDGKLLWRHSLTEEYNRVSGYGGRLMNPIIDEDRVVVSFLNNSWGNHAKPCHRYVAFDKRSGQVVWWAEPGGPPADTTYAIPIVIVADGRRMLIAPNADGKIYALASRTGLTVWSFALSRVGLNVSPIFDGQHVYVGHSEENLDTTEMGRLVCIDPTKSGDITKSGEVWRLDGIDAGYASPAINNGRIYLVDNEAMIHAIDAKTGKIMWKYKLGRVGKGSPVVTTDNVIYVGEQNGVFYILKDAGAHAEVLSRVAFPGPNNTIDEIYGSPAVVDGRVYFMTRYGSYCLGTKDAKVEAQPMPELKPERTDATAASSMLLFPADLVMSPGQSIKFEPRFFTESGAISQPNGDVQWSAAGVISLGKDGSLTVALDTTFGAGLVTAKLDKLTAVARVRICPKLPVKEDFEKLPVDAPPAGWIGVMGKTKVVSKDGTKCLCKLAEKAKPSPVWKMRAFSHPSIAGGYTVEADVLGSLARNRFRADMGLINSGYELILMGMTKELELSRWRDEPTHAKRVKIPTDPKTGVWYHMKLRVQMKDKKAMVQGKVWLRDEKEPAEWTIQFEDPCPNIEGSPGLFVYSNGTTDKSDGAEVFFDNYQVHENE
jgi:outer membrane protein assembly factor BamB